VDGSKVKAARDAKRWSQETLAKKTGYKVSVIQKFEQGTYFSCPCLTRVADVLEVKEDDLIVISPPPGAVDGDTRELGDPPPAGPGPATGDLGRLPSGGPYRFQKLLLGLNKELLRDPDLWGVYDLDQEPHPTPDIRQGDRQQQGKLHAFAYMCLNVFQTVYAFYEAPRNRDVRGPLYRSWYGTFKDFVNKSSWAQQILSRKDSEVVYDAGFLAYAKSLIEN